jgi:hypothetical protein
MSKWSEPKWIREELNRKWDTGRILRYLIVQDDLFPLRIPLKRPKSCDVNEYFAEISSWIKILKDNSKEKIGFGYEVIEREIVHRQSGRNHIPTHVIIPTVRDALRLLKKEREADKFMEFTQNIQTEWLNLNEWIGKYPHKVLTVGDDWSGILAVLRWFFNHPRCGLYLRQLDISGIDTKFIEQRKGILTELLNIILPKDAIEQNSLSFEQRYGLRVKPVQVRLRLLDREQFIQGISDMMIPIEQLAAFKPTVSRVFITENEINGLCFPEVKKGLVIFGLGYGVDVLKTVAWLMEKEIYYWGDIDTHGFAMLDQVRSFLPQTKSLLMDERILLNHRDLWSVEEKPFVGQLSRLKTDEHRLFCLLQGDVWGKGVRLEQERVSFGQVQKVISEIIL